MKRAMLGHNIDLFLRGMGSVSKWLLWLYAIAALIWFTGCRSFTEGDIVIRNGEAYIFTKALTREQIKDGKEIREMQNRVEGMNSFSQPNAKLIVEPSMAEYVKTNKPKETP